MSIPLVLVHETDLLTLPVEKVLVRSHANPTAAGRNAILFHPFCLQPKNANTRKPKLERWQKQSTTIMEGPRWMLPTMPWTNGSTSLGPKRRSSIVDESTLPRTNAETHCVGYGGHSSLYGTITWSIASRPQPTSPALQPSQPTSPRPHPIATWVTTKR